MEEHTLLHIQNLKTSAFDKLHFSPDGNRLAVIAAGEGKDQVDIYKTDTWRISRKLLCDRLSSIDGIRWSPNNELLCIWCSSSTESKLLVYSTEWEKPVLVFSPFNDADILVASSSKVTYNFGKELKGIERVEWNSSGQLLAVIGFNELIVLFNYITWTPLSQLYLHPVISECNYLTKVYKESADPEKTANKRSSSEEYILREIHERPICIEIGKKDNVNFSVARFQLLEFSACGQYLAVKHDLYPTTLWIWDISTDYLDYLLLENPITAIKWNPIHPRLLVFSECARVYEWTRQGVKSVSLIKSIAAANAHWHPAGEKAALYSYNKTIIYEST